MATDRAKVPTHRRKKRKRNPTFSTDSLFDLSWQRVVGGEFPHNRPTLCCGAKARQDEMVVTVPLIEAVDGVKQCVGTAVFHASCMRYLLEEVPIDISIVRERVNEIRETFVEGPDAG